MLRRVNEDLMMIKSKKFTLLLFFIKSASSGGQSVAFMTDLGKV